MATTASPAPADTESYALLHAANDHRTHAADLDTMALVCGRGTTGAVRMVGITPRSSATCPSCKAGERSPDAPTKR